MSFMMRIHKHRLDCTLLTRPELENARNHPAVSLICAQLLLMAIDPAREQAGKKKLDPATLSIYRLTYKFVIQRFATPPVAPRIDQIDPHY
jgi:hypothetical protein